MIMNFEAVLAQRGNDIVYLQYFKENKLHNFNFGCNAYF